MERTLGSTVSACSLPDPVPRLLFKSLFCPTLNQPTTLYSPTPQHTILHPSKPSTDSHTSNAMASSTSFTPSSSSSSPIANFGRGGYNSPASSSNSDDDESHTTSAPTNFGRGGYNKGPDDDEEEDGRGGYN
ncbi:uncharacterized protein L3040_008513 [Drepanopeziza brunnea f. sp. 'multigermtubi']|uniref:uncharacterized protein n=1 Tax=Drepanopeziza brunnea f. sp. 'multigermtubi' TaxID=698441 RepID=UPI00239D8EE8|nr:hypothetical protein L3040_008513 [Drepanopeziza brunnea f. sp. 'multigermtubi']